MPIGNAPVGVSPFNCRIDSDSSLRNGNARLFVHQKKATACEQIVSNYRKTEKTRAILPIARILLRITSLRAPDALVSVIKL